jgi:protein kinase C substrate 80K-H
MSSFVDDGICDCCDGSDESSPPTPCPNTCKEQGEKFLAGLQDELAGIESGLNQREKYIKDAVKLKLKWKSQLQKVERDIVKKKRQVDTMADKRSDLEKREQKLKELQKQQEKQQEKAEEKEENVAAAAAAAVASTPASPPASAIEQEASDDTLSTTTKEGESAENQAKRVAAQWIPGAVKEESDPLDVKPDDIEYNDDDNDDEEYGTAEEEEGDGEEEEEEEEEEGVNVDETHSVVDENTPTTTKEASSMLIRLFSYLISKIFIKSPFQGTFPTTPEGIHSALVTLQKQLSTIRSEHSKETSNLRTLEKEKSTLESNMKSSFGPDDAFAVLVDRCLSTKIDKYTYEVCPYKAAKQKEGSSSFGTDLGQWQGFEEGGFSVMKFGGGSTCWQGPARSMTVSVRCGAKDVLSHVQEPSRCEYTAVLETPAACHQSTKVYLMNRMQQAKDWSIPVVDATVVGLDTGDRIILNPTGIIGDNDEL